MRKSCSCGEAWADEPGHDDGPPMTTEAEVNANLAAVGEEIKRAARPEPGTGRVRYHSGATDEQIAEVTAEDERERFRAAGYAVCPVFTRDKRCSGGLEDLPEGRPAWEDGDGWLWCRDHLAALLSEQAAGQ